MRVAFFKPGAETPYAVAHRPVAAPPDGMLLLLGGTLEVTRGDFPGGATLRLSAPPPFTHGDWVRVWLDDDPADDPTYLGEVMGEPWRAGVGEVRARSLMDRVRRCRWVGRASGSLAPFLTAVLALTRLPDGITVAPLPDLSAVFEADTAFELLGDTLNAIEPALGGALFGVDTRGRLALVDPGTHLAHRFPQGMADTPPGATDNYANCVRFSFEYPSGDTGYFEGRNEAQIAAHGGEVWDVSQATVREIGLPEQPYSAYGLALTRTVNVAGQAALRGDGRLTLPLSALDLMAVPGGLSVEVQPAMTPPPRPAEPGFGPSLTAFLYLLPLAVHLTLGPGAVKQALAAAQAVVDERDPGTKVVGLSGDVRSVARVRIEATTLPDKTANEMFVWAPVAADGTVGEEIEIASGAQVLDLRLQIPVTPTWSSDMLLAYRPDFAFDVADAGLTLEPIRFTGPGSVDLSYVAFFENSYNQSDRAVVSLPIDNTTIQVRRTVIVTEQGGTRRPHDVALPVPVLSDFAPTDDPFLSLNTRPSTLSADGTAVLEFTTALTLPYGSSVEFEAVDAQASVGGVWVLPDASLNPTPATVDAAGYPLALLGLVQGVTPAVGTALEAAGQTSDRWLRYAVRRADGLAGQGDPPPDVVAKRLVLTGLKGIGRLRIKTPYYVGLSGYAARLLVYKAQPRREWTGRYRRLRRASVLGRAAFELPRSPDDVVLEVQKATYDLKELTVSVAAGVPEPATDEDAVAEQIGNIQRVIRRAGGTG